MLFDLHRARPGELAAETRQIIRLALPMMIASLAQVATGFVDTVMAGHVGTADLAAVSLGSSVFLTFYVTLMGVVTALNPILSHALGAGEDPQRIGETGRQGLWFGLFTGLAGMLLMLLCIPLLERILTLPAEVLDKVGLFIAGTAVAMPAAMVHRALHAYASSLNRPRPIMWISLLALLLNIPLNYILIHGLFGLPRMGGAGCGWATAAAFWFNALALFAYIARHRHFAPYGLTRRTSLPDLSRYPGFLRLGLPIGLSFFVEVSLFSFIALLVARLGTQVVAAHQTVLNFSSLIYMLPSSIAVALTVRIGQKAGAGDAAGARRVAGTGLVLGIGLAAVTMVCVLLFRTGIMHLYTNDPALIDIGRSLLLFAAIYQLTDAAQTIASGALRGYKLTTVPMLIHVSAFWLLGLGLGIVLGLTDWIVPAMGVYGFWAALVLSLSVAALLLVRYLAASSRRLQNSSIQGSTS